MPGLLKFEWEKCPDGYAIERFEMEYAEYSLNPEDDSAWFGSPGEVLSAIGIRGEYLGRFIARPTKTAPSWVHQSLQAGQFDNEVIGNTFVIPKSERVLKFFPLEENDAAFMEFAACQNSIHSLLHFICSYGVPLPKYSDTGRFLFGNHKIETLMGLALRVAEVVEIWEKAKQNNNFSRLANVLNGKEGFWDEGWKGEVLRKWIPHWRDEEYVTPLAEVALARASVRLIPRTDRSGPPILSLTPDNLVGALWVQFAQAVSTNTLLRRCAICPTWFSYGTGTGRRKSAHYCSDKCRKAAHRANKSRNTEC